MYGLSLHRHNAHDVMPCDRDVWVGDAVGMPTPGKGKHDVIRLPHLSRAKDISVGGHHGVALLEDGTIGTWGRKQLLANWGERQPLHSKETCVWSGAWSERRHCGESIISMSIIIIRAGGLPHEVEEG